MVITYLLFHVADVRSVHSNPIAGRNWAPSQILLEKYFFRFSVARTPPPHYPAPHYPAHRRNSVACAPLHNALACQNRKCDRLHGCAPFTSAIRDSPPRNPYISRPYRRILPLFLFPSALLSTMHLATPAHRKHIRTCIQHTTKLSAGYGSSESLPPRALTCN